MKKTSTNRKRIALIMKASIALMMILLLGSLTYGRDGFAQELLTRPVTIDVDQQELNVVLKQLEKSTKVRFSYVPSLVRNRKVSLKAHNERLDEVLEKLLGPFRIQFSVSGENIILNKQSNSAEADQTSNTSLQTTESIVESFQKVLDNTITGKVVDEANAGLPGVNVLLKGSNRGTATDTDGRYRLTIPEGTTYTLVFSLVGYASQEVTLGTRSTVDIKLLPDNKILNEVIVVGYGTQKKADLTGAVSTISAKDFQNTVNTNVGQALQGRTAGVQVTQNTGRPGDAPIIRVRGVGTTGNSNPLYVIDGVITNPDGSGITGALNSTGGSSTAGGIANINPDDIESITVLKDAASSAIYGARAANGVVLITTKRGKAGLGRVSFSSYVGSQKAWRIPRMANATEFATLQNEARANAGLTPYWGRVDTLGIGQEQIANVLQTAPIQNYYLSVSGGSEKSQYAVSLGYFNQQGIGIGVKYNRYSINVTSDHQVLKKFRVGNSLSLTKGTSQSGLWSETFVNAIRFSPTIPKYLPDGSYAYATKPGEQVGYLAPLGAAYMFQNDLSRYRILGNVYAEYAFTDKLKLRSTLGGDFIFEDGISFTPVYAFGSRTNSISTLDRTYAISSTWLNENTLSYTSTFQGRHNVSALVGVTQQANRSDNFSAHRENLPNNDIRVLDAASVNDRARGSASEWSIRSFIGRLNYNLDEKYLLSANLRVDGSSRFGTGNKYGIFPSFAGGWRVSSEKFMENIRAVNDLKIRASWGQLGNQEIGLYSFTNGIDLSQNYVLGTGQTIASGGAPTALGNPNIKWETTTMQDLGLDLALANNRISVTADYFIKDTRDMLVQVPIPGTTGVTTAPYQNAGAVRNSGFELGITYRKASGDFRYDVNANISTIKNRVLSLAGVPIVNGVFKTAEGHPINSIFGYVQEGVFQSQDDIAKHATQANAKPGDIMWKDLNGDNVINDSDRDYIGNTIPRLSYGFTGNASYKGFDLSLFIQGIQGREIFLDKTGGRRLMDNFDNTTADYLGRWTGPGTSNHVPRLVWGDPSNNQRTSDFFVYDASYVRIKNIQLGYTLPKGTLGVSRLRVYVSCQNLLTLTPYPWFDPEVGQGRDNNYTDLMTYPQPRTVLGGINIDF